MNKYNESLIFVYKLLCIIYFSKYLHILHIRECAYYNTRCESELFYVIIIKITLMYGNPGKCKSPLPCTRKCCQKCMKSVLTI